VPFQYRYDASLNCLFSLWNPPVTLLDLAVFGESLLGSDDLDDRTCRLNDLRALTGAQPTSDVRALAEGMARWDRRLPPYRAAHVVGSDLVFGLTRLFQTVRGEPGEKMAVFRDVAEAQAWLGLPAGMGDPFARDLWRPDGGGP